MSFLLLEFQSAFAGTVGESFNAPVINKTGAVKTHLGDIFLESALRKQHAYFFGGLYVLTGLQLTFKLLVKAGSSSKCCSCRIINDLSVQIAGAAVHRQSGAVYTVNEKFGVLLEPEVKIIR